MIRHGAWITPIIASLLVFNKNSSSCALFTLTNPATSNMLEMGGIIGQEPLAMRVLPY